MRLSQYFMPTLKETPGEAQIVSHRLMLRAGMIRQSSSGIYSWLPLHAEEWGSQPAFAIAQRRRQPTDESHARETDNQPSQNQGAEMLDDFGNCDHRHGVRG